MNRRDLLSTFVIGCLCYPIRVLADVPLFLRRNPYLEIFNNLPESYRRKRSDPLIQYGSDRREQEFKATRNTLVTTYSWAVPSQTAIEEIARFAGGEGIVDFGAGSGYWAHLISSEGVDVFCIDNWTEGKPSHLFHPVTTGSFELLEGQNRRALMLVWPPSWSMKDSDMAERALDAWKGKKLIYVGEPAFFEDTPRSTGTVAFFHELNKNWILVKKIKIPQWYNVDDAVWLFKRKGC